VPLCPVVPVYPESIELTRPSMPPASWLEEAAAVVLLEMMPLIRPA
jgi:hypothetical protein